jgi:hypothetical protein
MEETQQLKFTPLPVAKILGEALKFLFKQTRHFWIWFVCMVFGFSILELLEIKLRDGVERSSFLLAFGVILSLSLWISKGLLFALFAVNCHRIILLKEAHERWWGFIFWSNRETRFLIWSFLIYIIAVLMMLLFFPLVLAPLFFISSWFGAGLDYLEIELIKAIGSQALRFGTSSIVFCLFLYLLSRICLALPSTAIDEKPTPSWAWDLSTGNGWRLTLITGTIPFISYSLGFSAQEIWEFMPSSLFWIREIIEVSWFLFLGMIEIALLSEAYKELKLQHQVPNFKMLD